MKILLDLNVLIDVACRWEDFPASYELYKAIVSSADHEGCFPACGYTTLYYVINQIVSEPRTREVLDEFRKRLTLLPFTEKTVSAAHLLQMSDLEDACVAATALGGRCNLIATRDTADYAASPIPAMTPDEILADLALKTGNTPNT